MNLAAMAREFVESHEAYFESCPLTEDVLVRFGVQLLAAERARRANAVVKRIERAAKWRRLGRFLQWWRGVETKEGGQHDEQSK